MKLTASPNDWIVSAASSGISMPNSSSNAMTNSTVSRLSAPKSSMNDALSTTLSSSTPRCSTTIFLTRSAMSLILNSSFLSERLLLFSPLPDWDGSDCPGGPLVNRVERFGPVYSLSCTVKLSRL